MKNLIYIMEWKKLESFKTHRPCRLLFFFVGASEKCFKTNIRRVPVTSFSSFLSNKVCYNMSVCAFAVEKADFKESFNVDGGNGWI